MASLVASFRSELATLKGLELWLDPAAAECEAYLQKGYPFFLAETKEGTISGFVVCRVDDDVVWVEALSPAEQLRRQGVASELFHQAEELAQRHGQDTVYNWVRPNNDAMISFLGKHGYDVLNLIEIRRRRGRRALEAE